MADRPILFAGPMVRANLADRKTETRRVLKPQPPRYQHYGRDIMDWGLSGIHQEEDGLEGTSEWLLDVQTDVDDHSRETIDVRFAVGDRLWVRETAAQNQDQKSETVMDCSWKYRADNNGRALDNGMEKPWLPAIFMPRRASRLTLTVTNVRIQKLQEITEAEAIAEGVTADDDPYWRPSGGDPDSGGCPSHRNSYRFLWDQLNEKRGFGWDMNPWVVAVTYTVAIVYLTQQAIIRACHVKTPGRLPDMQPPYKTGSLPIESPSWPRMRSRSHPR